MTYLVTYLALCGLTILLAFVVSRAQERNSKNGKGKR